MKILFISSIILLGLFIVFQIYTTMATQKTETQAYKVVQVEKLFEIRHYPAAIMAKISSTSKSYRDLGSSGFGKLAKYIFGGNSENKQIGMTSPVHMDIGDSVSTMAFVMPSNFKIDNLPRPNSSDIVIETSAPEYVAVIQFGGFANTSSIDQHKLILENALKEKGLIYYGNFRYLGYNPPYQLFGRRNEVIVALSADNFKQ
jgi:SOUL heme-binding protein